jgi:DNA adenine methylase
MRYMGSKSKIAHLFLPAILKDRKAGQLYVEPFVGSASVITRVRPDMFTADGPRLGADKNPYVIALHQALQLGWKAPTAISESEYDRLKELYKNGVIPNEVLDRALMGFAGFGCSFGGKFFDGYAKSNDMRNYAAEAARSLPDVDTMRDIEFIVSDYSTLEIPDGSLVYCDPPYESTSKYKYALDHVTFWRWCDDLTKRDCSVFVSSYEEGIPADWRIIWKKEYYSGLCNGKKKPCTEVLATR